MAVANLNTILKTSPVFDTMEIVRDPKPVELTPIEREQQWSLARRFAKADPFVWGVTASNGVKFYFESAARATSVFNASGSRLEIAGMAAVSR